MNALKQSGVQITLPEEQFTYGRPNRPQTPIDGIIRNNFGEGATKNLQDRYRSLKQYKKLSAPKCNNIEIRYTKAKIKAEEFIKTQNQWESTQNPKELFKLKRFQNLDSKIDHRR